MRRQSAAPFTNAAAVAVLANWTPLLTAADSTKVVVSPIFTGFVIPSSEGITQGGNDNSSFNGIAEYYGEGSVIASGRFKNMPSAVKVAMGELTQESLASTVGISNLTAYFVNKDGNIFYTGNQAGIPIYNFRVGSVGSEGLNTANVNPFSFSLPPEWDADLKVSSPAFDPLTAL